MVRSELIQYCVRCPLNAARTPMLLQIRDADALREVASEMATVAERLEDWQGRVGSAAVAQAQRPGCARPDRPSSPPSG